MKSIVTGKLMFYACAVLWVHSSQILSVINSKSIKLTNDAIIFFKMLFK